MKYLFPRSALIRFVVYRAMSDHDHVKYVYWLIGKHIANDHLTVKVRDGHLPTTSVNTKHAVHALLYK